jgi:KDO2-lipid IV(A) lauroyltransferase
MARQIGKVQARIEYTGIAAIAAGLRAIPLERAVRTGARLGGFAMRVDRPNRPIALKNLESACPEKTIPQRLDILRAMYRNWGRMVAEWVHFHELSRANIESVATYEGKTHWDEAERASNGRGLIVLTGHFGNFELMQLAHSIYGYHIAIVHRSLRNPLIDAAVNSARVRFGNKLIPRKAGGRDLLKLLRQNWMIAIALDLDVRKGVFSNFFGMPASTSDAVARVAAAVGCSVVPCVMIRQGDTIHHKISISPRFETVKTRDREECVRENTQRYTSYLENQIRQHPDHWNWIHRRWKTRPPGEHRFY